MNRRRAPRCRIFDLVSRSLRGICLAAILFAPPLLADSVPAPNVGGGPQTGTGTSDIARTAALRKRRLPRPQQ